MEKHLFKVTIERSNVLESYEDDRYVVAESYSVVGQEYPKAAKIELVETNVKIL